MSCLEVVGGNSLYGEGTIQGSKNAILPMMAAALLTKEEVLLSNCPNISDVICMIDIMKDIGVQVVKQEHNLLIHAKDILNVTIKEEYGKRMRASVILASILLAREHKVKFPYPGGCTIGARPIDLHIQALEKMNVQFQEEEKFIVGNTLGFCGADIYFSFPSVGATQQAILAGVLAKGTTRIYNAAREPEIWTLCDMLNKMGARILGAGTKCLCIEGVECLHGIEYQVPCDRIVAQTYLCAAAGCGGEITLHTDCVMQMKMVMNMLQEMGVEIKSNPNMVCCKRKGQLKNIPKVKTAVYPGFPTDMQSIFLALLSIGEGTGVVEEEIFESRYACVPELKKMGADIRIVEQCAIVKGKRKLCGADVEAKDLRGGAALILAGLEAEGITRIKGGEYILRGYESLESELGQFGAKIRWM